MLSQEQIELAKSALSEREVYAYNSFCQNKQASLAPSLNAKLFQLFLNGKNCEEIRRLNPLLSLGQIVAARIEGTWDNRRNEHLDRLLQETSNRVQQATLETAEFVADLLAVSNREYGDKLRRYLQTGDASELGDFKIDSIYSLKQAIEVLQKLTGQDRQQVVQHKGSVAVESKEISKSITVNEAGAALKLLLGKK